MSPLFCEKGGTLFKGGQYIGGTLFKEIRYVSNLQSWICENQQNRALNLSSTSLINAKESMY